MEPMTLGSAPSSPSSPSASAGFLPAFLMGESSQPTSPIVGISTPGGRKMGAASTPDPRYMYPKLFNQMEKQSITPQKAGPPNQGLFDTIEPRKKGPPSPVQPTSMDSSRTFLSNGLVEESFNISRNFNDSVVTKSQRIETHWVTVFGFTPSALSLVLAQLSNCGVIAEKKIPTEGNWLHVKFTNLSDVSRALALNGRCISKCVMIGVSLHFPKENKENENVFTTPGRARALRQSFISPTNNMSVLPPQNVPQKSTGLVSKAFEYVFGW